MGYRLSARHAMTSELRLGLSFERGLCGRSALRFELCKQTLPSGYQDIRWQPHEYFHDIG